MGLLDYRPHGRRFVAHLAELTARELGLDDDRTARIRLAAMLCDVGRDQIPSAILNKRSGLTYDELLEVRRQPELGAALLADTSFDDIRAWIASRRERPDGRGYPRGLLGEQIPLEARILAVADSYVAMASEQAHRPARDHQEAILELQRCAGSQFDAAVVRAFVHASSRRDPHLASAVA
jgi:HD-GYP domain-containing protein (c-di-GMP phosphodiesterase class II)